MATVQIASTTYPSFVDQAGADTYIAADPVNGVAWAALDPDGKARFLVTATRILLRQPWLNGAPPVDTPPQEVIDAACEFAAALVGGYDLGVAPDSLLAVRRQKAGPVEVEYFRDFDNPSYRPPPLPQPVWDLIKPLLAIPDGAMLPGSIATGCEGRTARDPTFDYYGGRMSGFDQYWDRDWR